MEDSSIFNAAKNLVAVCKMIGLSDLKEVKEAEKLIDDMRRKPNNDSNNK